MGISIFNEFMKKEIDICGTTKCLTKKGVEKLLIDEAKDFIRSSPNVVLVDITCRPCRNQYLFTYKLAGGKNGLCHKTVIYVSRYQITGYFKEVENS